ncbi:MAG: MmgE/PrpD family protein [Deltaproteobacteria bacterium]|nr:MmgE/PrpD family protein [Deltaproteobacteria bacterium]
MTSTIERLASWAARLTLDDVPPRVREKARWQQASVLAASFGGLEDPAARTVVEAARAHGAGPTPVLAGRTRAPRPVAVLANATLSCTFDFDEILLLGHPGHSAVTVPLALGAELGRTWGEVLTAQVAADEIEARLGLATILGPQNGQLLPFLHCAGAAVAAGRLLGLDERALAHALAVSLAQPPAALWPSFLGAFDVKVLTAAHGTAMGVWAAELAARGFTGALDLLDHPRGFFHRFAFVAFPRALGGLGRAWLADTLQVKLHAACWYYQALLDAVADAAGRLAAERGRPLRGAEVRRVVCRVSFLAEAVDASARERPRAPLTANEVNFSIPAAGALTLLRGRLRPADLSPPALRAVEDEVRAVQARVQVVHDLRLTRRLVQTLDRALDVGGLIGTATIGELATAARRARHEFPHGGRIRAGDLLGYALAAPRLLGALRDGRRHDYDLGDHDLAGLTLPIPGALEVELDGGRRLVDEREVPAGALALGDAPGRVRAKLEETAAPRLGAAGAARLWKALAAARPATPVASLIPPSG